MLISGALRGKLSLFVIAFWSVERGTYRQTARVIPRYRSVSVFVIVFVCDVIRGFRSGLWQAALAPSRRRLLLVGEST